MPDGSGGWTQPPITTETTCLECHGNGANHYQCGGFCPDPTNIRDKTSYLMSGHKNMLRKVAPDAPWAGADGTLYGTTDDSYGSGSIYDWTTGTVNVGGTGTIKPLFYIFGGWIDRGQLNTIFDGGFTGEISGDYGVPFPGGNYDCARCHTTGYRFDATGPEPTTYSGTPITDAQFSRYPTDLSSGTSSWYLTSIQCERCHRDVANEAGGHNCYIGGVYDPTHTSYDTCTTAGGAWTVVKPTFEAATALCLECHRQESADPVANTITLSTDLLVSDGGACSDGVSPDYASCVAIPGNTWNYAPFFDASAGQAFLSSPHARFAGTLTQAAQNAPDLSVSVTGTYNSLFADSGSGQNQGCPGCHDVHQSTVEAVHAPQPITSQCGTTCHTAQANLARINHLFGPGTPLGDGSDISGACKTCHMPQGYHFFRINPSASYSTFPTAAELYLGGQTSANTAPDGTYTNAVWLDVDLACGQCHGGGTTQDAQHQPQVDSCTEMGVPFPCCMGAGTGTCGIYRTKEQLAVVAKGIHNGGTITYPTTFSASVSGLTVNVTASVSCNGTCVFTYEWDWGDGSPHGTGASASYTYASAGTKTITLTVTGDAGNVGTATRNVTLYVPDNPPVPGGMDCGTLFDATDWTASFTDASTDDRGGAQVFVDWGDGSLPSRGAPGSAFSHTYRSPGAYLVVQKVIDSALQMTLGTPCAVSPAAFTISGTVETNAGAALGSATVTVRSSTTGVIAKAVYTSGLGTFSIGSLKPDTYWLIVAKRGYTFPAPAATITVGPSSPGNVITANP